ncbi:MAG: hypothetical protein HONBIEJF_00694 [Fimbriimonadaceae bacterium]|nr:hypothetical protein [Fimbriimonadaceae bacterium]
MRESRLGPAVFLHGKGDHGFIQLELLGRNPAIALESNDGRMASIRFGKDGWYFEVENHKGRKREFSYVSK